MNHNKIGKFIAACRKEKGLTQKELGDRLFVTDKAVSKWERGVSLPDITLLEKLASELDVEVIDILTGEKGSARKIDIQKEIQNLKEEICQSNRKKIRKIVVSVIVLLFMIIYLIFRSLSFGYKIESLYYAHSKRNIHLGIPKMSFLYKHNDRSYSYKNLRDSSVLESEIRLYLKKLKRSSCNNTIYYYNEKEDFSIIDYSVKSRLLYSTISYEVVDHDYCYTTKLKEYESKLGGLLKYRTLHGGKISLDEKWDSILEVIFQDGIKDNTRTQSFQASLKVLYYKRKSSKESYVYTLEDSTGNFEIKDDKLYYYRTHISEKSDEIHIPEVSTFRIEDANLILLDDYLSKYEKNITLK